MLGKASVIYLHREAVATIIHKNISILNLKLITPHVSRIFIWDAELFVYWQKIDEYSLIRAKYEN